jgi:hypothetical protein
MCQVNLYDVLRVLISKAALPETVANDCLKVIDETEKWNALGTTTKTMEVEAHQHRYPPYSDVCDLCGRGRDQ